AFPRDFVLAMIEPSRISGFPCFHHGIHPMKPVLLATLSLWALVSITSAKEYEVYYLGGQSNMDGYGYVRDLPESLRKPVQGVMIFHGNPAPDGTAVDGRGLWAELKPGHGVGFQTDGKNNKLSDRFGVELTFAQRLKELRPHAN